MSGDPKKWVAQWIGSGLLPAMEQTVDHLRRFFDDPDPFEHLPDVIHRDPGFTCHLFSRANGLHHRHFGMPVTTVEHAMMMLGLNRIRGITEALPLFDPLKGEHAGLSRTYGRAYHAAHYAWVWARLRADMVPWEVFTAALLHPVGEMAVWYFQPERAEEIEDLVHGTGHKSREVAQRHVLGFRYDELSAELARLWKLPILLHDALRPQNAARPRVKLILLAQTLARAAERSWNSHRALSCLEEVTELLHQPFAEVVESTHRAAEEASRAIAPYGLFPVTVDLTAIPPGAENEGKERVRSVKNVSPLVSEGAPFEGRPEVLEETIRWFRTAGDDSLNLSAIMRRAADGIHQGIGLSRVVFAACTPDGKSLRARVVRSSEESAEFEQLRLDLQPAHLFTRLMEKPASIWVNTGNRDKFGELLPPELLRLLDTDSFFARSLFLQDRPLGMFYCDCHRNTACLDEQRYKDFQHLCDHVTAALQKATVL